MSISRQEELTQLREYIKEVDKEVTIILQSLHWDKETLLKSEPMVTCKYNSNHRIPVRRQRKHEEKCYLKSQGYKEDELYLPEPFDPNAKTLVKFTPDEINQIINKASKNDPLFKKGNKNVESQPLTVGRLAAIYTVDERRAFHDAVVNTMPSFHDLADLALPSTSTGSAEGQHKSRLEVLAELRDTKRRRAKYRVSGAASNYSHTLRELIATQMQASSAPPPRPAAPAPAAPAPARPHEDNRGNYKDGKNKRDIYKNERREREIEFKKEEERNIKEDKYNERGSRHSIKHESYSRERDRRYNKHNERKMKKYNDPYSRDGRSSSLKDRKRHHGHHDRSDREQRRERSAEKSRTDRSGGKHRRYYDYEYSPRENSRRKDNK